MEKEAFGRILKRYRKRENLSQLELARLCGQTRQYIQLIESGSSPSVRKADEMLRAIGASLTIGDGDDIEGDE